MKILHVCAIGMTVKKLLIPQIDYLSNQGITVEIACSPGAEVEQLQMQGYTIHPILIERRLDVRSNFKSVLDLMMLMRRNQYDLVHVHTPIAAVLGRIAAKLAGVKSIVYTAHGFYFHDQTAPFTYRVFHTIETLVAKFTDLIIAVNHEDVAMMTSTHLCPADKTFYIGGDGVDLARFNPHAFTTVMKQELRVALGISATASPIIGTVGRLNKTKGSGYLVDAVAQLRETYPNIHVLIVGGELGSDPDPFQQELLAKIQAHGLEQHITLTGNRDDVPAMMAVMDIFTLPTFAHEGLPTVIIEAMAMAKPVIATDIRGCREAIVHGATGLIVPPKDAVALAAAITHLITHPRLAGAMGEAGRQRAQAEYDVRLVCQRLHTAYASLGALTPVDLRSHHSELIPS
jgi:glycosyltransferase involved in cell wall biosynthesis